MGLSQAGFHHEAVIERDRYACDTIRENQRWGVEPVVHWPLRELDVREVDYSTMTNNVDLLAGGPPCQPFSFGGKHRGSNDSRDMFPEVVRATRELAPRALLFENVRGLLRPTFAHYFRYILLQISFPEVVKRTNEAWSDHLRRLDDHRAHSGRDGLTYRATFADPDAADYGVPQRRRRVLIVGFRNDVAQDWAFPTATHSRDALLWEQLGTGEYWERHEIARRDRPPTVARPMRRDVVQARLIPPTTKP